MIKKLLLTLILISGLHVFAAGNFLNSVVIERDDSDISIILRADEISRVKKDIISVDKILLTLKDTGRSADLNTLYKNISDVKGLVIQNESGSDLKIYIDAPGISKAKIVFETPDAAPVTVNNNLITEKVIWSGISVLILLVLSCYAHNITTKEPDINEIIKEHEKAMYKNFQKEIATVPSINYKLKSYRTHVLKGETLRSYNQRLVKFR